VPTVDEKTLNRVVMKDSFYKICEKVGISYPKTISVNKDNYQDVKIEFGYPVVAKVANKAKYQRLDFEGKMKVFIINSYEELINVLDKCFLAGYDDEIVIQEYIAGEDANMRVLTCFCDQKSNVLFSAVGQVLLEEKGSNATGNYAAIVNTKDDELVKAAEKFLKETKYKGYANFDIKYDENTGRFYFFEVNVRLGRSNFYMGAGGFNYLAPVVDTYIYNKPKKSYIQKNKELYHIVPLYVIKKYVKDKELVKRSCKLKRNNPLDYKQDFSLKRKIYIYLALLNHIKKYQKNYR
jgi:D-aspartate ligase